MEVTRLHFLLSLWPLQISHSCFFSFSSLSVIHSEVTSAVLHLLREWGWSIEIFTKKKKKRPGISLHYFLWHVKSLDKFRNLKRLYYIRDLCSAVCAYFGISQWSKIILHWRKKKENPLEVFYLYDFHIEIKEMKENKLK